MIRCTLTLVTLVGISPLLYSQSPVDRSAELEKLKSDFGLADGPAWNGRALEVPDVKAGVLWRYFPGNDSWRKRIPDAGRISATFFQNGLLYLSNNGESRIETLDPDGQRAVVAQFAAEERPNDLVVDPEGRIYVTLTRQGTVVRVDPDGSVTTVAEGLETPNGIILAPDNQTLYVSEFRPKRIVRFAVDVTGGLGEAQDFAAMEETEGLGGDGMTTDRAGNVYCAGPDAIWIWSPGGELLDRIETLETPINCAFGGQQLRELYIASKGGVYRQAMRIAGRSPNPPPQGKLSKGDDRRPSTEVPPSMTAHLDVVYAATGDRKLLADIFVPDNAPAPRPAILVVHGGGWLKGDKTKFRALAIRLAEQGFVTAAIEYRLGEEAHFPAAMQDCAAAVRFLRGEADRFGIDPQRIGAVGGSAGGHLVGLMAAAADREEFTGVGQHGEESAQLQAAVVLAGPLQIASGSVAERSRTEPDSNANLWIGKTIDEAPAMYQLADAYEQLTAKSPPTLFICGSLDNPDRNAPARRKLSELGVPTDLVLYENARHGAWNTKPWFDRYVAAISSFMKAHLVN